MTTLVEQSTWPLTNWTLSALSPVPIELPSSIPATVPGSVHTDLLAAGLIPDPYLNENEKLLSWIGRKAWRYAAPLPGVEGNFDRVDLVCDGLDTVATVRVNDVVLGETANMHRRHRFPITECAAQGGVVIVDFAPPIAEADRRSLELGPRPYVGNNHPYNALRKMACSYGWDWGIDTASAGIWRGLQVEAWNVARIDRVLSDATVVRSESGTDEGAVSVRVRIERAREDEVRLVARCGSAEHTVVLGAGQTEATLALAVGQVERWWPVGHGSQPLYDLVVTLEAAGVELGRVERRMGFRTVRWNTTPDAAGTPFTLVVNDRKVLVKGVNWIPDDCFPHRVTPQRYRERFEQALSAGVNLIRVWGGGIYEDDAFFDLADELGLLTWQDFLLACAAYAEDEPLRSEIEAEARDNVARLAHHASLVLFCGNNENLWGKVDWAWDRLLDGKTWGAGYYHDLFPRVVDELAPLVPYAPGSPWSPAGEGSKERPDTHPNDVKHGSMHIWDAWNSQPATIYRSYSPRFVAEFGWQGPPAWTTLREAVDDEPLTPESPGVFVHQKAAAGNAKLTAGLLPEAPLPQEMELWHWAMQWNQAQAVRLGIEWYRSIWPHCTGTIVWQLNDCWPVISWAAIDGNGRPKPLLHALKHVYSDRLLTLVPEKGGLRLAISNDTDEPWQGEVRLSRLNFAGELQASETFEVSVAARGIAHQWVSERLRHTEDATQELLLADLDGARAWWFFVPARDSALEPTDVDVEVSGDEVRIHANVLVRDLTLLADKTHPDAAVGSGMVTLLPGDEHTFRVSGATVDEAGVRRGLASLNDVIVGTRS